MPLVSLALALVACSDQSGEAVLREVLARSGRLHSFQASVSKSARDRKSDAFYPTSSYMVAFESPRRFRIDQAEMWGDCTSWIQDGKTLKVVTANGGPARLRNPVTSPLALGAPGSGSFTIFFLLLEGPAAYDKLVAPGSAVSHRGNWLQFKSKDFGNVSMRLGDGLVREIEFDNRELRLAQYRFFPMWSEKPEEPMEIESITVEHVSAFARGTFDTSIRKGEEVLDERKKG